MTRFYHHQHMQIVSVSGEGAAEFLNDLLTAQITRLDTEIARMACLLSPQGRILFDMMVFRLSEIQLFLLTETSQAEALAKRLTLYRLRRKLDISLRTEFMAGHIPSQDNLPPQLAERQNYIIRRDERHDQLGYLCLAEQAEHSLLEISADADWQALRIGLGIPQTAADLTPNRALMLEAGLEHLHAVDFKKGCYIGQEVTARTHYRGLVKRRILPVHTATASLQTGQIIRWQDKEIGTILSVSHTRQTALATIRLDAVRDSTDDVPLMIDQNRLSLDIPAWMQPLPGFDDS